MITPRQPQPDPRGDAPILIVGCPRSGTTLLRDLLRSHPRLTFPHESRVIPALYRAYGDPADAPQARRLARAMLDSVDIASWRLPLTPSELEHHRSFTGLVTQLYTTWADLQGKSRWGDKTPLYVLELDTMRELFPDAQIIHVIRDGRDVALSLQRQPWGPSTPYTAALMWRRAVRAGRDFTANRGGESMLQVRYERLLANPEQELRRICTFLREDFDPAVLVASRLTDPLAPPHPWPRSKRTAVDPSNAGRWRTEMSAAHRVVFESVAGEELERAGYPRAAQPRHLSLSERLRARLRDAVGWAIWRLTAWDRVPRAQTTLILIRACLTEVRRGGVAAGRHRLTHYG